MKKLLALLSSIVIAGSSASAVISCGIDMPAYSNNDHNDGYDPDNSWEPEEPNDNSGNANGDITPVTPGAPTDNGNTNNNKPNKKPDTTNHDGTNPQDIDTVVANMKDKARYNILRDQYGLDDTYAKEQLGITADESATLNGMNDKDKWTYGSKANNPFIDFLVKAGILPESSLGTINTILPLLDSIDTPSPTQLGGIINQVSGMAGMLGSTINGLVSDSQAKDIKTKAEGIFTPVNKAIVDELIKSDNTLDDKYNKLTLGDSLKSALIGAANILAIGTDDSENLEKYNDLSNIDNFGDAGNYVASRVADLTKDSSGIKFDINKIEESTVAISSIADMIKLLGLYISGFDKYEVPSDSNLELDKDHVFAEKDNNGNYTVKSNYDVIKTVRAKNIKDANYKFDILEFITNISYYLGKLDKQEGIYRLQAFMLIFLADEDKSDVKKFSLSWTNNYGSGDTYRESDKKSPIMSLLDKLIPEVMLANEPDGYDTTMNNIPVIGSKLKWPIIVEIVRHNVYMILQSLAWNRGVSMSDEKLVDLLPMSTIDEGFSKLPWTLQALRLYMEFPGLNVLPEWKNIENDGLLYYLFNGNVYEFIKEVKTNPDMQSFYKDLSKDIMKHKDADKNGNGGKDSATEAVNKITTEVMDKMKPFTSSQALKAGETKFVSPLGNYSKIEFRSGSKETILNTNLDSTASVDASWGTEYNDSSATPVIQKVIAEAYDKDSNKTKAYVYADGVLQTSASTAWGINNYGNNGKTSWNVDDFGSTIKIDGKAVKVLSKTSPSDGGNYGKKVTFTVEVSGRINSNSRTTAEAWRFMGKTGGILGNKNQYYAQKEIANNVVNEAFIEDELNIQNILNISFADDNWKNIQSISLTNDQLKKLGDLSIIGYKKPEDKDGSSLLVPLVNMKSVAAWNISSLLGILGVQGFTSENESTASPLGLLPVADKFSLGEAILELGNIIHGDSTDPNDKEFIGNYEALHKLIHDDPDFSYKNFADLANVVFGDKPEDNIVNKVIDAIRNKDLGNALKNTFGIKDTNMYDANKLIGVLITTFTKGSKAKNGIVYGSLSGETPLWTYLFDIKNGVIRKAWNTISDPDNKVLLSELFDQKNYTFEEPVIEEADKNNANKVTMKVTYKYSYQTYIKGKDDKEAKIKQLDMTGTYTVTWEAGNASKNPQGTYTITKN